MADNGYASLVNMTGGMHGAFDEGGNLLQAGWGACGFEQTVEAVPERTWASLSASGS